MDSSKTSTTYKCNMHEFEMLFFNIVAGNSSQNLSLNWLKMGSLTLDRSVCD